MYALIEKATTRTAEKTKVSLQFYVKIQWSHYHLERRSDIRENALRSDIREKALSLTAQNSFKKC
jgi:hypothetical protein